VIVVTPQFKAAVFEWLNAYGPLACVGVVLAACLSTARKPRGR
jgi:hypothetical protein